MKYSGVEGSGVEGNEVMVLCSKLHVRTRKRVPVTTAWYAAKWWAMRAKM